MQASKQIRRERDERIRFQELCSDEDGWFDGSLMIPKSEEDNGGIVECMHGRVGG